LLTLCHCSVCVLFANSLWGYIYFFNFLCQFRCSLSTINSRPSFSLTILITPQELRIWTLKIIGNPHRIIQKHWKVARPSYWLHWKYSLRSE
jgi:hypothetical protein